MRIFVDGENGAEIKYTEKKTKIGTLVTPTLFVKNARIAKIEFVFDVPKKNAVAYNNGFCTNDFVEVKPLKEEFMCRDIVLIKGDDGVFSCGMITAERFLTRFFASGKECRLRIETENKLYDGEIPLEEFLYSETCTGGEFFSGYCDVLAEKYNIVLPEKVDTGWSSWSYYYRTVTEQDCREQEKAVSRMFPNADLIQIDDAWQVGDTFSCQWEQNGDTFKTLEKPFGKSRLGLWMAPTLAENRSKIYIEQNNKILKENGKEIRCCGGNLIQTQDDGSVFPLDLQQADVREMIADSVKNVQENYNCHYFKLDFLIRSLIRQSVKNDVSIYYEKDNCIYLYQQTTRLIREKVGKDTFMMACGAPITESVGTFDGIRTSPDITWCMSKNHVGYWYIMKRDAQNVFLRSFYHGKVFICDPDALIVRGHKGKGNDDFTPTFEEARLWATVVALSGGTVLINEDLNGVEKERLELIKQVMEPIGIAALPDDMFELPYCSHVTLTVGEKMIKGVFNFCDEEKDEIIKNNREVLAFDCWSKEFLGEFNGDIFVKNMTPHSCRAILLVPKKIGFAASTHNLFMGIKDENITDGWYYDGKNVCKR